MRYILLVFLSMLSFYSYSQKLEAKKVPQLVKSAFSKAHPNSTASWEREDADYEANFKEGGMAMSCVINKQGTILETESSIKASDLPTSAKDYMSKHYKGKKWKEVAKIIKADGSINYEVNVGIDVLFDANGNHLEKTEKKEKD